MQIPSSIEQTLHNFRSFLLGYIQYHYQLCVDNLVEKFAARVQFEQVGTSCLLGEDQHPCWSGVLVLSLLSL